MKIDLEARRVVVRGSREDAEAFLRAYLGSDPDEPYSVSYGVSDDGIPAIVLEMGETAFAMMYEAAPHFMASVRMVAGVIGGEVGENLEGLADRIGEVVRLAGEYRAAQATPH